ncbi:NAD(P)H-dependent glycerol-3-phosphate dehydrogenase [Candidatus Phycosocius spiralis]|uniref:Glycerol-3-phosphate dehydrogenase [NAD(P)+] n=1 Tax=Candidatus Phycosocius spiralis TaxID=2815099 RepID=A0ABQ4PW87_9PROT|nr:NAD(P)H-dependent glycerol-3-phosphate dehydrogenase [Candidatus Phycosocius spiralis]GIU67190.1 glycerol-3-phosphate dehydrogenase [NAD(P)+] [Candidatus Phycosocius spiralis]
MAKIGIVGGGAWGTALAQVAAQAGHDVTLWAREAEVVASVNSTQTNQMFLPNIGLSSAISATGTLADLRNAELILAVVPAQFMRQALIELQGFVRPDLPIILCSKGIEQGTHKLMTQVLEDVFPQACGAVLSGPSFAKDVAIGLPTAVTLACQNPKIGADLVRMIGIATFRPYLSLDLIGAEIGGAVKNVLAIGCGMAQGKGLGESARAALITRGFAEMTRLGVAMGADTRTLAGLCGLGDLVLTCSSTNSRNFALGLALGQGHSLQAALAGKQSVAEGAATAPALLDLASSYQTSMPICEAVAAVLSGQVDVGQAIGQLLSRPFKHETD